MDIVIAMNQKVKHALDEKDIMIRKLESVVEYLVKTGDCPDICPYRDKKACPANKEDIFNEEICWNIVWREIRQEWML